MYSDVMKALYRVELELPKPGKKTKKRLRGCAKRVIMCGIVHSIVLYKTPECIYM